MWNVRPFPAHQETRTGHMTGEIGAALPRVVLLAHAGMRVCDFIAREKPRGLTWRQKMIHARKRRTMELGMKEISISSIMRSEPPIENLHLHTCAVKVLYVSVTRSPSAEPVRLML